MKAHLMRREKKMRRPLTPVTKKQEKDSMIRQMEAFLACRIVNDQVLGYR